MPCDPLTGLRIVDRRTSRADMVDAFSSFTYRSCSILAAASFAEWISKYLVDGGNSNGSGAPSGKTNVATCGILTGDVSSRLSNKTGRAFAMLSLGDLPSSMHAKTSAFSNNSDIKPSISVFLFGDALGALRSNKKYMNAGYAVAVLGPNLMPPRTDDKNGGGTSITLSVNDPRQIVAIGRASDCDRCKGTMRVRSASEYGGMRWEDSRCNVLVDLRLSGGYCHAHRRQGLSSSVNPTGGKGKSNKGGNTTFMQRQRIQNMPQHTATKGGGVYMSTSNVVTGGKRPSSLAEALSQSGLLDPTPAMPGPKTQLLKRAPLHMKKTPNASKVEPRPNLNPQPSKPQNPYLKQKPGQRKQEQSKRKEPGDILGEALRKKMRSGSSQATTKSSTLKSSTANKKSVKVFHTEGYDGAVQVPKPSKLFSHPSYASKVTPSPASNRASSTSILEKQRSLAEILKGKGVATSSSRETRRNVFSKQSLAGSKQKILGKGGKVLPTNTTKPGQFRSQKPNSFAAAFGNGSAGQSFDRDAILNAKSRFASAVDAQEYARARAVVQELECREATKDGNSNNPKKKKEKKTVAISTTGWACRTCQKATPFKPMSCIRARHDVRQKRELKEGAKSLGSRKDRLDRHGRDQDQGGLTLGSGIEWSGGWRGELG